MQERRRFIRWQVNRQTQAKLEGAVAPTTCTVHDISFKGARISLTQQLPKDTNLKISIVLSEEFGSLDIEMWVVWHRRIMETNVYGLYFTKIKDSDKESIYKFMRKYFAAEINKQWWQEQRLEGGEKEMQEPKFDSSKDRRIFERFSAKFPLRFIDLKRNKEGQAQVQDVSAKGLGIIAQDELTTDTTLEMWLDVPDRGEPLYTRGEVVWSKLTQPGQWRLGVDLEKADLMAMSRILRKS